MLEEPIKGSIIIQASEFYPHNFRNFTRKIRIQCDLMQWNPSWKLTIWKRNMSKERMAGSKGFWMFLKKLTVCFRTGCLACRRVAARGKPTRTPPTLRRNHGVFPDQLPEKGVVFPHCVLVPHWKASKVVPPNYCSYACWLITGLTWSNYSYDMWKSP